MAKMGRKPALRITAEILQEVEKMAGVGLTQHQIADYYGVSKATWCKIKNKNPRLRRACKQGKSKAIVLVAGRLMQLINAGNVPATLFWLKTRAGWNEKNTLDIKTKVKSKDEDFKIDTMDAIEASKIYQSIMTGSYNNVRNRNRN